MENFLKKLQCENDPSDLSFKETIHDKMERSSEDDDSSSEIESPPSPCPAPPTTRENQEKAKNEKRKLKKILTKPDENDAEKSIKKAKKKAVATEKDDEKAQLEIYYTPDACVLVKNRFKMKKNTFIVMTLFGTESSMYGNFIPINNENYSLILSVCPKTDQICFQLHSNKAVIFEKNDVLLKCLS